MWSGLISLAAALLVAVAGFILVRWRHSPLVRKGMGVVAGLCFVSGLFSGLWVYHFATAERQTAQVVTPISVPSVPAPIASPALGTAPSLSFMYHLEGAVLPDSKLTPGDTFPGVTVDDVCTPGWARDHRHVTESEKADVYAEYGADRERECACGGVGHSCCEVDHLIPLELGGSNDIKNLWPQPDGKEIEGKKPGTFEKVAGDAEKDQLENELHHLVCTGKISLADAQKCIASNWLTCWQRYVVPLYGPTTAVTGP